VEGRVFCVSGMASNRLSDLSQVSLPRSTGSWFRARSRVSDSKWQYAVAPRSERVVEVSGQIPVSNGVPGRRIISPRSFGAAERQARRRGAPFKRNHRTPAWTHSGLECAEHIFGGSGPP